MSDESTLEDRVRAIEDFDLNRIIDRLDAIEERLSPPDTVAKEAYLPPDKWDRFGVQWTAKRYKLSSDSRNKDILWESVVPDDPGHCRIVQMFGEQLEERGPFTSKSPLAEDQEPLPPAWEALVVESDTKVEQADPAEEGSHSWQGRGNHPFDLRTGGVPILPHDDESVTPRLDEEDDVDHYFQATIRMRQRAEAAEGRAAAMDTRIRQLKTENAELRHRTEAAERAVYTASDTDRQAVMDANTSPIAEDVTEALASAHTPTYKDVVVDVDGHPWIFDNIALKWTSGEAEARSWFELVQRYGPVRVARANKPRPNDWVVMVRQGVLGVGRGVVD